MTSELQRAWAAGFIDGEGCLTVVACTAKGCSREQYQGILDVCQAKPAPLDALVGLFGGGVRPAGPEGLHYRWRLHGHQAARVVEAVLPYLVAKRRQAELFLEFCTLKGTRGKLRSVETMARQAEILTLFRVLNARRSRHAERLSESAPEIEPDLRMVR